MWVFGNLKKKKKKEILKPLLEKKKIVDKDCEETHTGSGDEM